ncbi:MAG: hypothetical protein QOE31_3478 [Solirubrobacteraceae bacterium]|jgi:hypothetical protein|nr:hypothetical protein [Solirubrobacteraceae bacterium]
MPAARRILAAASSSAAVLALAAPAHAATVATLPCVPVVSSVSGGSTMQIAGAGFTPGALVTVRYASTQSPTPTYLTSATADPAGNFSVATSPPLFAKFDTNLQTFGISATDGVNPAVVAGTTFKQVRVGYTTNPSTGKPSRTANHTVRGFPVGKNIYLHFRFGGETKRNVKVGRASAPCGIASKRMRLLPTRSRPGKWTVYVDQASSFHKTTRPQLKYSFVIRRTFG